MDGRAIAPRASTIRREARVPAWLPALVLLVILRAIAPGGYLGGGGDDWYYLDAARCFARTGWCLPDTHWATRWPLIAPMAVVLRLAGEGFATVAIVPLAYASAAIVLFACIVERRFGGVSARWAALALTATPAVSGPAMQPMVDLPELVWLLAALLALQAAVSRGVVRLAALAGACAAIAVMTRLSALAMLPVIGLVWLMLGMRRWTLAAAAVAAFTATLAVEAALYGIATGDAAYGWMLSLHHARIASSELPEGVDLTRSALFNLELIRNWRRSMGIEVHWTIDPLLNLLADPQSGLTLIAAAVFALVYRPIWANDRAVARTLAALAGGAVLHALVLVFVLAIDPKPRMFLPELAVAATIMGVIGTRAWADGRRLLTVAVIALMGVRALVTSVDMVSARAAEPVAARWIAEQSPRPGIDDWSRRSLALEPAVMALLPVDPRTPVLRLSEHGCKTAGGERRTLLRSARFDRSEPAPVAWLRTRNVLFGPRAVPSLCLFSASDRAGQPLR